jgi:O-antigen/teichoic acid export membrane protein
MTATRGLTAWARHGTAAVADQGLFAVSNFVAGVLLARWLGPREYGAYALAFALFLFFSLFHTALVSEPMLVFGASRYRDRLPHYLGRLATMGGALSLVGSAGMLAGAAVAGRAGDRSLVSAFLGFGFASPCILYLWMMRRVCYVRNRPDLAVSGGLAYLLVLVSGIGILRATGSLSPGTAAAAAGVAGLAAAAWLIVRLGAGRPLLGEPPVFRDLVSSHWEYGRWAAAAAFLSWLAANLFPLLLPLRTGLEGTGALTAMVSLVMPAIHAETALSLLLLPALAERRGTPAFGRLMSRALLLCAGGAVLQWILFGLLHSRLTMVVYGPQYDRYSGALWVLGLIPVFFAVTSVLGTAYRALERPRRVFVAHAVSAVLAVGGGWALIRGWGFAGAAFGYTLSYAVAALTLCLPRGFEAEPVGQAPGSVIPSRAGENLGAC